MFVMLKKELKFLGEIKKGKRESRKQNQNMNLISDQYKFRILQAEIQFSDGNAVWEEDLSALGSTFYFASVCGLAVNDTFACSITNGDSATARLIIWELNTPNFGGIVNVRIFVACK